MEAGPPGGYFTRTASISHGLFGADNAEFEARLDAAKTAVSWLAERVRDHSRGMGPDAAHAIANGSPDRFSRAGFVNGAAARAAFDAAGVWAAA